MDPFSTGQPAEEHAMQRDLQRVNQRLEAYERQVNKLIKEFHDEKSMSYFSDRFGPDHPLSERADYGVTLQHRLAKFRHRIKEFATQTLQEFPDPTLNQE